MRRGLISHCSQYPADRIHLLASRNLFGRQKIKASYYATHNSKQGQKGMATHCANLLVFNIAWALQERQSFPGARDPCQVRPLKDLLRMLAKRLASFKPPVGNHNVHISLGVDRSYLAILKGPDRIKIVTGYASRAPSDVERRYTPLQSKKL